MQRLGLATGLVQAEHGDIGGLVGVQILAGVGRQGCEGKRSSGRSQGQLNVFFHKFHSVEGWELESDTQRTGLGRVVSEPGIIANEESLRIGVSTSRRAITDRWQGSSRRICRTGWLCRKRASSLFVVCGTMFTWCVTKQRFHWILRDEVGLLHAAHVQRVRVPSR